MERDFFALGLATTKIIAPIAINAKGIPNFSSQTFLVDFVAGVSMIILSSQMQWHQDRRPTVNIF